MDSEKGIDNIILENMNAAGYFFSPLILSISKNIIDKRQSVFILIGGTSGSGKSTLASILASRMGVQSLISTDHVRQILRTFHSRKDHPVLFASSYQATDVLDSLDDEKFDLKIIRGYEMQCDYIYERIALLMKEFEASGQSFIMEGVHLSPRIVSKLAAEFPNVIPFMATIESESRHAERFAIRAKYMTLEPRLNKYIHYFDNIRCIQSHISKEASVLGIPILNNTSVDKSVFTIHDTIVKCLEESCMSQASSPSEVWRTVFERVTNETLRSSEALLLIRKKINRKRSFSDVGLLGNR